MNNSNTRSRWFAAALSLMMALPFMASAQTTAPLGILVSQDQNTIDWPTVNEGNDLDFVYVASNINKDIPSHIVFDRIWEKIPEDLRAAKHVETGSIHKAIIRVAAQEHSDMIVMFPMTASIAGGILFYRYYRIMAGPAANAFMLILRFWVAEMIAMITMMLPYGILGKMGIFGKLLGGLVSVGIYGFLFLFGYHDYEESKKAGSNKAEDYYRSVIKPEEDKLAAEYQRKYQVLADKYAPLKKLSSAWEVYLEKEGDE